MICNAPEDQGFANRLRSDLRERNLRFWGAGQTSGDSRYVEGYASAVRSAAGFIFICSKNSIGSNMLKLEIKAAFRESVPIFMIAIDDAGCKAMQKTGANVTRIDMRSNYNEALNELVMTLTGSKEAEQIQNGAPNPEKGYVFLSYAEADTKYMQQVKDFMTKKGYGYWEFQSSSRDYQANLALDLEKVLRAASATLTILSPSWKESTWSMREFLFSQQVGIPVLLLRFEDVEPTLAIADILYIDFVGNRELGFQRLDKELGKIFNDKRKS